jgi:hypothetical protein
MAVSRSPNGSPEMLSRSYPFVRSRQLEGTYPGEPALGVWGITGNRVSFGWGNVDETVWPYFTEIAPFGSPEPTGVDRLAKANRIHHYARIRNLDDCLAALEKSSYHLEKYRRSRSLRNGPAPTGIIGVVACFEITRQFLDAPDGIIANPPRGSEVIGAHAVSLVDSDSESRRIIFQNSWGRAWGKNGF